MTTSKLAVLLAAIRAVSGKVRRTITVEARTMVVVFCQQNPCGKKRIDLVKKNGGGAEGTSSYVHLFFSMIFDSPKGGNGSTAKVFK